MTLVSVFYPGKLKCGKPSATTVYLLGCVAVIVGVTVEVS